MGIFELLLLLAIGGGLLLLFAAPIVVLLLLARRSKGGARALREVAEARGGSCSPDGRRARIPLGDGREVTVERHVATGPRDRGSVQVSAPFEDGSGPRFELLGDGLGVLDEDLPSGGLVGALVDAIRPEPGTAALFDAATRDRLRARFARAAIRSDGARVTLADRGLLASAGRLEEAIEIVAELTRSR